MVEYLSGLTVLEQIFLFSAVVGGALFLLRLVLMIVGGDADGGDADIDVDMDLDGAGEGDVSDLGDADSSTDASFKVLSLQTLTGFFMMGGLVGLAMCHSGQPPQAAVAASLAAGLATVWVTAKIFRFFVRLQSSGTVRIENAVGRTGVVYLTIPARGTGKVHVRVQRRLREYGAVAANGQELQTGTPVVVTKVGSGNTLVVAPSE